MGSPTRIAQPSETAGMHGCAGRTSLSDLSDLQICQIYKSICISPTISATDPDGQASVLRSKKASKNESQENIEMKFVQYFTFFTVIALVLSVGALAKDSHSGNFTLADTVQVGSTQLAPGNYKAEWDGPADNLKINIVRRGKTVATTEGKIKDLQQPAPYDAVALKTLGNNTKALDEIEFNNRNEALVLAGE